MRKLVRVCLTVLTVRVERPLSLVHTGHLVTGFESIDPLHPKGWARRVHDLVHFFLQRTLDRVLHHYRLVWNSLCINALSLVPLGRRQILDLGEAGRTIFLHDEDLNRLLVSPVSDIRTGLTLLSGCCKGLFLMGKQRGAANIRMRLFLILLLSNGVYLSHNRLTCLIRKRELLRILLRRTHRWR